MGLERGTWGRDLMQRGKVRGRGRQLGGGAHMQLDRCGQRLNGEGGDLIKREEPEAGPTEDQPGREEWNPTEG